MKMMPGQTPYTPAELARLNSLIGSSALATEVFSEDELEYEAHIKRKAEVKKPESTAALGTVRPETKPTISLSLCEPNNIYSVMARCRAAAEEKGWTPQHIGDFRGNLFRIETNKGYEAAMKFVGLYFVVEP